MRNPLSKLINATPVPQSAVRPSFRSQSLGGDPVRGSDYEQRAMGVNGTLFATVDRYATAVAGVEWCLYKRAASGEDDDRQRLERHPAWTVWHSPNPFYTTSELVETVQQHYELVGEGCMVLAYHDRPNIPGEIWPINPKRLRPVPHPEQFISGYVYFGPDGEQVPLALEEVIRFKRPCPWDPHYGLGAVQSIIATVSNVEAAMAWNRSYFLNSAEPGGVIEYPEEMSDPEFETFKARWDEMHRGVSRANRVAFLEKGMKFSSNSMTHRDMQFVELVNVGRDVIQEAFRIHPHLLGRVDDVNKANAEAAEGTFGRLELMPRLCRWKEKLNREFLTKFPDNSRYGLEFDHHNPVPEDRELEAKELTARTNAWSVLVTAGADPDEASIATGLPEGLVPTAAGSAEAPLSPADPASIDTMPNGNGRVNYSPEDLAAMVREMVLRS